MARRPQHEAIDWDVIERQYRLGLKSNAVLAAEFGVDASSIGKRAKRLGWVADKASEVAASANALLIRSAAGNSSANSTPTTQEVQAAARATADVVLEHRQGLRRLAAERDRLLREQEALTINAAALQELVDALRQPDDQGADRRNDLVQKLIALPQRVENLKKLTEIDERIRRGEREAYGVDAEKAKGDSIETLLARIGRA